jgi:3-deoxy-D-arabino-heptulosonate 7-phosphate (DAHP) synthase class II
VEFLTAGRLPLVGYRGAMRYHVVNGGSMSSRDRAAEPGRVRLNEEDVAYVMNLLRNATQPVNTQQLIDVLRRHPGQFQSPPGSGSDSTDEASA